MIRAMRPRTGEPRRHRETIPTLRTTNSTAFTRRSLGLSATPLFFTRRSDSGPIDSSAAAAALSGGAVSGSGLSSSHQQRSFDPFQLVRRLPTRVSGPCYVKSARHLAVFSRFERYWLELRGRLVVMFLHDHIWTSASPPSFTGRYNRPSHQHSRDPSSVASPPPKDAVIVAVFTVEKCLVSKSRSKAPVLKITNPAHPHHVWLRFDSDHECNIWEKALSAAASQRVVGISDFEFVSPIGRGASGKVFLVTDRNTGEKLALKVIDKSKVFESKSSLRHALDERLALEMVDGHPFFCRLRYAFQTKAYFYLAIDFYDGGDLYQYLRTHNGRLDELQVRAVAAEVIVALEHLHSLGFVYRDLKPENVLLDCHGHVRLADFGLCKLLVDKPLTDTICGTHTYAAPEMLVRNYGKSIDLWAYGVFVYHILRGRTPYEARDLDQVIENMNLRRIRFSKHTSKELVAMIKKLLDYNPNTRLGCGAGGMLEVRSHPFFKGLDWRRVYLRDETLPRLFMNKTRKPSSRSERGEPAPQQNNADVGATSASASAATGAGSQNVTQANPNNRNINNNHHFNNYNNNNNNNSLNISNNNREDQTTQDVQTRIATAPVDQANENFRSATPTHRPPTAEASSLFSTPTTTVAASSSSTPDISATARARIAEGGPAVDHDNVGSSASVKDRVKRLNKIDGDNTTPNRISRHRFRSRGRPGVPSSSRNSFVDSISTSSRSVFDPSDGPAAAMSSSLQDDQSVKGDYGELNPRPLDAGSTHAAPVSASASAFVSEGGETLDENQRKRANGTKTESIVNPANNTGNAGRSSDAKAVSLREQMVAAAEQDDLRNFDMAEWGKISVDNDHDDVEYGDGALWPFARTNRKLVEEDRLIAGFGYCSCSSPMGLPDHLQ